MREVLYGDYYLQVLKVLQMLGPYLSSYILCATALDRRQVRASLKIIGRDMSAQGRSVGFAGEGAN